MSDKTYHDSTYSNFMRPPCAQQPHNPYSMPIITNSGYNPSSDYMYAPQAATRNQAAYTPTPFLSCSEQLDTTAWLTDPRAVADIERGLRYSDKMETIEITSKDLSPASCCSNIDLLIPDFYKGSSKDVGCYNRAPASDSQWYCNFNCSMQRYSDYPSCSQMSASYNFMAIEENKSAKYFCMQKSEFDNGGSTKAYNNTYGQCMQQYNKNAEGMLADNLYCQMQENQSFTVTDLNQDHFYPQNEALTFPDISNIGQSAGDGSNDESDIIVEESEEEVTDYSEDLERRYDYASSCIVCNVLCTPVGAQFYILTTDTPLTMSSQQPVSKKLSEMIGTLQNRRNYLCAQCLSLINTIDHLQLKLDSSKTELYSKYEKTCKQNSIFDAPQEQSNNLKKNRKIRKFKNFCGLHSFKCRLCKKTFSIKKLHESHMMKHKFKNKFLCELCGQQFSKYSKFLLHRNSHRKLVSEKSPTVVAHTCKVCDKPFRTKSNLTEHENYCSNKLPYQCERSGCDKKFATITKLKNHTKLKHDKKFIAICSICNVGFVKLSTYKSHKLTHNPEKKFNCTKCEKSYKTASNLNHHMKFHRDKLPFMCTVCSKGFMRKEYLESHVNNHMGVKNFSCQVCDKKFVSQKNLDAHIKYHDGSIKKKVCNICNKCVTTGFEEHLRTHSNLREFDCNVCEMKFNTKGALAKHTKRKHSSINNES